MTAMRLCLAGVQTWGEIETRLQDGPIVDGRSAYLFAQQDRCNVELALALALACDVSLAARTRLGSAQYLHGSDR
eukprot:1667412-Pleurochrysis_carterae.AAC.1